MFCRLPHISPHSFPFGRQNYNIFFDYANFSSKIAKYFSHSYIHLCERERKFFFAKRSLPHFCSSVGSRIVFVFFSSFFRPFFELFSSFFRLFFEFFSSFFRVWREGKGERCRVKGIYNLTINECKGIERNLNMPCIGLHPIVVVNQKGKNNCAA